MTTISTDRRYGVAEGLAAKAPVRLAATGNLSLSGLVAVDGVQTEEGTPVLAWLQSDTTKNGIWLASSGPWTRRADFNGIRDAVRGTRVFVAEGATHADSEFVLTTSGTIAIGTTALSFTKREQILYTAPVTGAIARAYVNKFSEEISIRDFLPYNPAFEVDIGDKGVDISTFLSGSNRHLKITPGKYRVSVPGDGSANGLPGIIMPDLDTIFSNVSIVGAGSSVCEIFVEDGSNRSPLSVNNVHYATFSGFTLNGNRDNNTENSRHGFRIGGDCHVVGIHDVRIIGARGYGLGAQRNDDGTSSFRHFNLSKIHIEGCNNDGIDVKNQNLTNVDWNLNGITILDFARIDSKNEFAAIDIRCPANMRNIYVRCTDRSDISGIRTRKATDASAEKTHISGFHIVLSTDPANFTNDWINQGIDIEAPHCVVSDGHVQNADRGIQVSASGEKSIVKGVTADGCHRGLNSAGGNDIIFTDCIVTNSVQADTSFAGNVRVSNCQFLTAGGANEGHWAFAEQGSSNLNGLIWSGADALSWRDTNGVLTPFPVAGRTFGRTAYANDATLALTDMGKSVDSTKATAMTITVPDNATVAFPTGTQIPLTQLGAGQLSIAAAGGVTLRAPLGLKIARQYGRGLLEKIGTNEWVLSGDLTT